MEQIIINGKNNLNGTVKIEGSKNAVLPIMAATILASEDSIKLKNVPPLSDVSTMSQVLKSLNIDVKYSLENKELDIDATHDIKSEAPEKLVEKMRASIVVLGPLLARTGHAKIAMPGGCAIGTRPIDLHLKGLKKLGATFNQQAGFIEASAQKLVGANIYLDFPSVGATQNILMAATLAEGETVIENVAQEPEIVDLANFLNMMGAKVVGAGTDKITVTGVNKLHGCEYSIMQDRIEAGTFMVAAACTNGNILIEDGISDHNQPLIYKLEEMGAKIENESEGIRVIGPKQLQPVDIKTAPYPGFPTDMQAQMSIAQCLSNGTTKINETVFENRFMHLEELRKMGVNYQIEKDLAVIYGPSKLQGASVTSTDLRAAAALVIAGLAADGVTRVSNLKHLDRGYYQFTEKIQNLGGKIRRVSVDEDGNEHPIVKVLSDDLKRIAN